MIVAPHTVRSRNGDNLEVLLRRPDAGKLFPTVLFVQGIGMDMHEWKNSHDEIAEYLIASRFATVQFDFSYQKRVTPALDFEIGLAKRARELEDVIAWTRKQPHVDPDRIGIYAMSFGVSTVLLADTTGIRTLVLTGGIGFQPKNYIKRFLDRGDVINRNGETRLTRSNGKKLVVHVDFWTSLDNFNQEVTVKTLTLPVLVIHGDNDEYLHNEDTHRVFDAIASKNKSIKVISGGGHGFSEAPKSIKQEFIRDVLKWFRKTL